MKKQLSLLSFLLICSLALAVAGCSSGRTAKEAVVAAYKQQNQLKAYSFSGTIKLHGGVKNDTLHNTPEVKMFLEALNLSELHYHGSTSVNPMRLELTLDANLALEGTSTHITMPILMEQGKVWMKIPAVPAFPEINKYTGKYLESEYTASKTVQNELSSRLLDTFFSPFDAAYFIEPQSSDIGLPADVAADRIVAFRVTNDMLPQFLQTLLGTALPKTLDLLAKSEFSGEGDLAFSKERADELKARLEAVRKQLQADSDWKNQVELKKAEFVTAIDKQNNMPYQRFALDLELTPDEQTGTFAFGATIEQKMHTFNKEPHWELTPPNAEETIHSEDLFGLYGTSY